MTTIAYKEGIIAYESRVTSGDVVSENIDKHIKCNGRHFFYMGILMDALEFIQSYDSGECRDSLNCNAFMCESGQLYLVGHNEGRYGKKR